jgi:Tol biopolymer transport system component
VFFPGVRRAFHVPHAVVPTLLAMIAVLTGVTAWAIASRSNAGIEPPAHPLPDIASIRSVAYTLPGHDFDDLVVRPADDSAAPRVIATFPNSGATGYHIHGASSPLGESIAVVSLAPFTARSGASLSIVSSNGSVTRQIEGVFDYFTRIAWAPDGSRLAAVRYHEADGARMSSVVEIEPATGQVRTVAEFPDAIDVVPVGYSFDSERLYIVVVGNRGSNLHVERAGKVQLEAELSPGRTRDWALSPDGSRLAFVDILAGGSRTFVGRTLVIATKTVTTQPASADQFGASWMPGSPMPAFGGPGGSWQLTEPESEGAYLVPAAWSPDSSYLVGSVYAPAGIEPPTRSLELVQRETATTPGRRTVLSDEAGAAFFGWVKNLD